MSEPNILKATKMTTSRGLEIEILGVPIALSQKIIAGYERKNPEPQPPTYDVEIKLGNPENPEIETHSHDETTLETEEDKEAWAKYLQDHADWRFGQETVIAELLIHRGLRFDVPEDGQWIKDQIELADVLGIDKPEIPEGKLELRRYYLESEGISSNIEYRSILAMVQGQTFKGLDLEAMQVVQDRLFRRQAQK